MKKLTLAFATLLVALAVSAVAFVPSKATAEATKVTEPQKEIPITIVDKRKRRVKLESLSPENRERVERVKRAALSLQEGDGPSNLTVHIHCSFPPLRCTIDVVF